MPASSEVLVALPADVALHARPAGQFVKAAMGFKSQLTVAVDGRDANAKSILQVLALGATGGTVLTLRAEGEDAAEALDALAGCIDRLTE